MIYRATTLTKLGEIRRELDVAFPRAQQRIGDSAYALLSADFKEVRES
jgi:hypothetical protein